MDKQTPTQIASEIMNNRGKFVDTRTNEILAYHTAWENELEKINNYRRLLPFEERMLYEMMTRDLIELTSALKILNTKEAEK